MNTKTCTMCGESKPTSEFYKDKGGKDGHRSSCKCCTKRRIKETTDYELKRGREVRRHRLNPAAMLHRDAKKRALKKGVPFSITTDDISIPSHCPVFGFELKPGEGQQCDTSPSLDRIIPSLGYVPGNIEVISYKANRIKNDATAHELRAVADYYSSKES